MSTMSKEYKCFHTGSQLSIKECHWSLQGDKKVIVIDFSRILFLIYSIYLIGF